MPAADGYTPDTGACSAEEAAITTDKPGQADVIKAAIEARVACVRTALPATILSYDQAAQTAQVQVLVLSSYLDENDDVQFYAPPPLSQCPVIWPSAGGNSITFPLAAGDPCFLLVSDRSSDEWKRRTRSQASTSRRPSQARPDRRGCLARWSSPVAPAPRCGCRCQCDGLAGPEIKLGSSAASELIALASKVETQLARIEAAMTAAVVVAADGGLSLKTTFLSSLVLSGPFPASTAASKVKAE